MFLGGLNDLFNFFSLTKSSFSIFYVEQSNINLCSINVWPSGECHWLKCISNPIE